MPQLAGGPAGVAPVDADALPADAAAPIISAASLMNKNIPPLAWTVPGLLPEGLTLLAGKPKMGKSWLALQLALAVAAGSPFLGCGPATPGPVLYLALEDHERRLQERLRLLLRGTPASEALALALEWERLAAGGEARLEGWLRAHDAAARLVIVDTLARVRPAVRPGAPLYQEDYRALQGLKRLAERYAITVLVVHHTRKQGALDPLDEISGSTGLTGVADGVLVLRRQRGHAAAVLHVTGRDLDEREIALTFDASRGNWIPAGEGGAAREVLLSPQRRAVLAALHAAAPETRSPHQLSLTLGKNPEAVRKLLSDMARAGEVRAVARGQYTAAAGRAAT